MNHVFCSVSCKGWLWYVQLQVNYSVLCCNKFLLLMVKLFELQMMRVKLEEKYLWSGLQIA